MNPERAVHESSQARFVSVRIVAIYVVVSGMWIAFSDRLLTALVSDPVLLTNLQTAKGWLFVAASAGVLYWLIYRSTAELQRTHEALRGSLDEHRHAERVQAATYQISETANRVGDLQELFQSIHRIIGELMPAQNLYIALYDAETNLLSFPYFVDEYDETSAPDEPGRGLTEYVLRTGEALLAPPEVFDELVRAGEVDLIGAPSVDWLGVPLKTPTRTIGVLVVQSYTEGVRLGERDQDILTFVSEQVAMVIERKQAEEALRKSEERYRSLVTNIPIGIYRNTRGPTGRFVTANPAFLRIFGIDSEESLSELGVEDLYLNPDERKTLSDRLIAQGSVTGVELQLKKRDGTPIWGLVTLQVEYDSAGAPAYVDGSIEDITERKRAEAALTRRARELETLYQTSLEIIGQPDPAALLPAIVERAAGLLGTRIGGLYLLRPDGETLELVVSHNLPRNFQGTTLRPGEGLSGRVAQSGEPLMVEDYGRWEGRAQPFAESPFRRVLGIPLKVRDKVIGVINIADEEHAGRFSEEHVRLASLFADQAALAIENARLFEAEREQRALAEALRDTAAVINSTLHFDEVLDRLLDQIARVVPYDAANIMLVENRLARIARTRGYEQFGERVARDIAALSFDIEQTSNLRRMAETGKPLVIADTAADPGWIRVDAASFIRSWAGVPVVAGGRTIAFLSLDKSEPGFYQPKYAERLQAFADQAAIAIENARLFGEAHQRAQRLALINEISIAINRPLTLNAVLQAAADGLADALGVGQTGLALFDETRQHLRFVAEHRAPDSPAAEGLEIPLQGNLSIERILASKAPLAIADAQNDPLLAGVREIMIQRQAQSILIAPLIVRDEVIGTIGCDAIGLPREFTADDQELVQTVANLVAARIEQTRLWEVERARRQELEAVHQASLSLTASLDLPQVLHAILSAVRRLAPLLDAHIFLYDGARLTFGAATLPDRELNAPYSEPRLDGLTYTVARTGETIVVEDSARHPLYATAPADWSPFAIVGLPLRIGATVVGVMNVAFARPRQFQESELRMLSLLAAQAAVAIHNAHLHEQAQRHAAELEQRVAERTRELAEAVAQLTELDRLKDQFVSNVSHELRTPLANVKLYLSLLEHGRPDKRDLYLSTLSRESLRLEKLIEDLLDLSRIAPTTASVHVMPTNINHIAADLIAEQRTAAAGHDLTLDCVLDPRLPLALADPNWIAQIMTNLMLNAIHYTPAGGLVTLSSAVLQDRGQDWITFSVQDTGPGISPKDMPHLFKRFYRGEAGRASGLPGTGLGLAICREIIDKLGGRITVDSQPGAGATFTVWIQPARD